MFRFLHILVLVLFIKFSFGQIGFNNTYFPREYAEPTDWKVQLSPFLYQEAGSNTFTNEFFSVANKSQYLDKELIQKQIDNMTGKSLSGQITSIGLAAKINSNKNKGKSYIYLAFEHQHYFDTYIDDDLAKLLMKGNKPFADQTLEAPDSKYYNTYFNQLKGGMGHRIGNSDAIQYFTWAIAFNAGQNYDNIEVQNSSLYTQPEGDYIDITANANTQLSDTVWAEVYEIRGLGLSADVEYSYTKPEDFHFDITLKNLGFINWNGNTFVGDVDTSFVYNGLSNDTTSGQNNNLPDDYSYNSLRRFLFKNAESSSFTSTLPLSLRFSAGKYFGGEKFYAGLNGTFYPLLKANYNFEVFATWNMNNILYVTPLFSYGSYGNFNFGLGLGVKIIEKLHLQLGSRYLNSMFNKDALVGSGGFIRLTFIN